MDRILFSIIIALLIIFVIYSGITIYKSNKIFYEVLTFDNEIIKVNANELYRNKMYIYKDDEKTLIKSYRRIE